MRWFPHRVLKASGSPGKLETMFGVLNINKPPGLTSRDVVNHVQRRVRPHKVGHAGTLDPLATGVLVLCLGPATRLIKYVQRMPKRYLATFRLGCLSDTEDAEGHVENLPNAPRPTLAMLEGALPKFLGRIQQRPPAFSALKVDGQRAYKLARAGKHVDMQPREIEIYSLRIVKYAYPRLVLDVACGGGTYIRSLGRDIAEAVGTAAVMEALQRTAIGEFHIRDAYSPIELPDRPSIEKRLLPPQTALSMLPRVTLDDAEIKHISSGRFIDSMVPYNDNNATTELVGVNNNGQLVAVLGRRKDGRLGPTKNFAQLIT